MRNLITGVQGFAASHLCDLLLAAGEEVCGIARTQGKDENIRHAAGRVKIYYGDIRLPSELRKILEEARPERIYHMASVSFVPAATRDWNLAYETNVFGTLHLFEAVKQLGLRPRIMCVGSSEEYGLVEASAMPVRETAALRPITLYGVTKASTDLLANFFVRKEGMDILRVRPFNHTGPRQESRFVCSSFARQIAGMEMGEPPSLKVGNLQAQRDFMDVRDTVRAYKMLMEQGCSGEVYNVCSGQPVSIDSVVTLLRGMTAVEFGVEKDPARYREDPYAQFYGDHSRLTQATGWQPQIPLAQSLRDTLEFWRGRRQRPE